MFRKNARLPLYLSRGWAGVWRGPRECFPLQQRSVSGAHSGHRTIYLVVRLVDLVMRAGIITAPTALTVTQTLPRHGPQILSSPSALHSAILCFLPRTVRRDCATAMDVTICLDERTCIYAEAGPGWRPVAPRLWAAGAGLTTSASRTRPLLSLSLLTRRRAVHTATSRHPAPPSISLTRLSHQSSIPVCSD